MHQLVLVVVLLVVTWAQVVPLAEHIDLKDHYLAFIQLENFGITEDLPDERWEFILFLN